MKDFNDLKNDEKNIDIANYTSMEFIGRIMAERDRLGISQRELSRISNVSQKTISRLENGLENPSLNTVVKLADSVGLEIGISKKS